MKLTLEGKLVVFHKKQCKLTLEDKLDVRFTTYMKCEGFIGEKMIVLHSKVFQVT